MRWSKPTWFDLLILAYYNEKCRIMQRTSYKYFIKFLVSPKIGKLPEIKLCKGDKYRVFFIKLFKSFEKYTK